jgi:hypothetical protein
VGRSGERWWVPEPRLASIQPGFGGPGELFAPQQQGGGQKGKGEWRKERSGSPPPASNVALRGLAPGPLFLLPARVEPGSGLALWFFVPGPVWVFLGGGVGVKRGG